MSLKRLRYLMKLKGLTSEELEMASGVPKSTIDKIASGHNDNPGYKTIRALVQAIGMTIDDFLDIMDIDFFNHPGLCVNFSEQALNVARSFDSSSPETKAAVLKILDIWEKPSLPTSDERKNA